MRQLLIEDTVISDGEAHTVVGFTPMSVTPAEVQLQPLDGGERFWIDRSSLGSRSLPDEPRSAFRPEPEGRNT